MRPRGDITAALVSAAAQGPGPVRELAARAQVGYAAAAYTASRMVRRGELVVLQAGRPALLAVPDSGDVTVLGCVGDGPAAAAAAGPAPAAQRALHAFFFVGQAANAAALSDPD